MTGRTHDEWRTDLHRLLDLVRDVVNEDEEIRRAHRRARWCPELTRKDAA